MRRIFEPWVFAPAQHGRQPILGNPAAFTLLELIVILGILFLLLPVMGMLTWLTWPYFWNTWVTGEVSGNIGGLVRWPATLLMPLGFAMVFAQGVAEIIKRVAYLGGRYAMNTHYEKPLQ